MNVSETRRQFSDTLDRIQRDEGRIIIEKHGIPVAALVPMSILREAQEREQRRRAFLKALESVQSGFAGISEEDAEREIEKALAEIKQERLFCPPDSVGNQSCPARRLQRVGLQAPGFGRGNYPG